MGLTLMQCDFCCKLIRAIKIKGFRGARLDCANCRHLLISLDVIGWSWGCGITSLASMRLQLSAFPTFVAERGNLQDQMAWRGEPWTSARSRGPLIQTPTRIPWLRAVTAARSWWQYWWVVFALSFYFFIRSRRWKSFRQFAVSTVASISMRWFFVSSLVWTQALAGNGLA